MKFVNNDNNFVIYLNKKLLSFNSKSKTDIEEYIKTLILKIKKLYKIKISGSYNVDIYENRIYGIIIDMNKKEDLYLFPDLIDLKLNIFYNSPIYLEFEDYFIIKKYKYIFNYKENYYLNIEDIIKKDLIYLSEFCNVIYGKLLLNIRNNLKMLKIEN